MAETMTAEQYMRETARTWQTDGLTWREQASNATLGLVGEVGEFCREPSADELGDCTYYAVTLCRILMDETGEGIPAVGPKCDQGDDPHQRMLEFALRAAECVKKWAYHHREDCAREACACLGVVLDAIDAAARWMGLTLAGIMAQNIDKLRERHPDGWSTDY